MPLRNISHGIIIIKTIWRNKTMTKSEFVTYCIQHDERYPDLEPIDLATAQHLINLLDDREEIPFMSAQDFMDLWNAGIQDPAIMEE